MRENPPREQSRAIRSSECTVRCSPTYAHLRLSLTQKVTLAIEIHVLHSLRMTFNRPFKLSRLPIPQFQARIFAGRDELAKDGVESYSSDG